MMGKVIVLRKKTRCGARTTPPQASHLAPLLEPVFRYTFDGKSEDERRALLGQIGEAYGSVIKSYFGARDAAHFGRAFCGGVKNATGGR
jgi:hypothetical protein